MSSPSLPSSSAIAAGAALGGRRQILPWRRRAPRTSRSQTRDERTEGRQSVAELCRMILDVDTGIDDAMAILYALNRPGIRLEACTTTFGNTDVDTATGNTLRVLELAGR